MNFKSTSYDWLVIAGANAKYKGVGTINGDDGYSFMLTAHDGALNGGADYDTFRIKIWETSSEDVIYDNMASEDDNSNAGTVLGGGSIVIHTGKGK
jgi:hypothetical protein